MFRRTVRIACLVVGLLVTAGLAYRTLLNEDALTRVPGSVQWGGDRRRNNGGRGGHPLTNNAASRLFMGGGGGAGDGSLSRGLRPSLAVQRVFIVEDAICDAGRSQQTDHEAGNTNGPAIHRRTVSSSQ